MMQYKKGNQVEVLCKQDAPSGYWRCAEVVSGEGPYYTIKYCGCAGGVAEENVPQEVIRPSPPPVAVMRWALGQVVEVLHNSAWKMAAIMEDLGNGRFLLRVLGLMMELLVDESCIRIRQFIQDGQWNLVETEHIKAEGGRQHHKNAHACKRHSPNSDSEVEASLWGRSKFQKLANEDIMRRATPAISNFSERSYRVALSSENQGSQAQSSSRLTSNGLSNVNMEIEISRSAVTDSIFTSIPPDGADDDLCFVGSCSNDFQDSHSVHSEFDTDPDDNNDDHYSSDCESSSVTSYEVVDSQSKEDMEAVYTGCSCKPTITQ